MEDKTCVSYIVNILVTDALEMQKSGFRGNDIDLIIQKYSGFSTTGIE